MAFNFGKINSSGKHSNEAMLLEWLRGNKGISIASHDIQLNAVQWIREYYEHYVSPDTISRLWRKMREDYRTDKENSSLYQNGLTYREVKSNPFNDSRFKKYEVSDAN